MRGCRVHPPKPWLVSAQASAPQSAAAWPAVWSTTRTPTSRAWAKSNHLGDAQIQTHIGRPGSEIVWDDPFTCAARAGEWIGIETAVRRSDGVGLGATGGKRGASIELIVAGQIGARGDVVRSAGVDREKRREGKLPGSGDAAEEDKTVMHVEAGTSIIEPGMAGDRRRIGHRAGVCLARCCKYRS